MDTSFNDADLPMGEPVRGPSIFGRPRPSGKCLIWSLLATLAFILIIILVVVLTDKQTPVPKEPSANEYGANFTTSVTMIPLNGTVSPETELSVEDFKEILNAIDDILADRNITKKIIEEQRIETIRKVVFDAFKRNKEASELLPRSGDREPNSRYFLLAMCFVHDFLTI